MSIPYSQALRVSGICPSGKDFKAYICRMKQWFLARGFSEKGANDQINKVDFGENPPAEKSLESGIPFLVKYHPKVKESGIPFVAIYHSKVKDLGESIKDLLLFLHKDEEVEKVFLTPFIVSYRSARKIKDYIVRSKLYSVERSGGCEGCGGPRCQVCENIKVTDSFTSFATKNAYKINHSFDCNDNV